MIVVTANQAPTLMNILEQSSAWKLRWVPTADHEGVSEMTLMRVPRYEPSDNPVAALVCAPHQIDVMRTRFPRAKVVWVAHNGWIRPDAHMFSRVDACLAFSKRVAALHEASTGVKTHFISPWDLADAEMSIIECWPYGERIALFEVDLVNREVSLVDWYDTSVGKVDLAGTLLPEPD